MNSFCTGSCIVLESVWFICLPERPANNIPVFHVYLLKFHVIMQKICINYLWSIMFFHKSFMLWQKKLCFFKIQKWGQWAIVTHKSNICEYYINQWNLIDDILYDLFVLFCRLLLLSQSAMRNFYMFFREFLIQSNQDFANEKSIPKQTYSALCCKFLEIFLLNVRQVKVKIDDKALYR